MRYRFGGLTFGGPYFRNFTVRPGTSLLYEKCIINLDFHVRHFGARDQVRVNSQARLKTESETGEPDAKDTGV